MGIEITSGGVSKVFEYYPTDAFFIDANGNLNTSGQGQQVMEAWFNGVKYYPVTLPVRSIPDAVEIINGSNFAYTSGARKTWEIDFIPYVFTDTSMTKIFLSDDMTTPVIHLDCSATGQASSDTTITAADGTELTCSSYLNIYRPLVANAYSLTYAELHKDEYGYYANKNADVSRYGEIKDLIGYFPTFTELRNCSAASGLTWYCINPFETATVCILNVFMGSRSRHKIVAALKIPDQLAFREEWADRFGTSVARIMYYSCDTNSHGVIYQREITRTFTDQRQEAMNFSNCSGSFREFCFYINGVSYVILTESYFDEYLSDSTKTNLPIATCDNYDGSSTFYAYQGEAMLMSAILGRNITIYRTATLVYPTEDRHHIVQGNGTFYAYE